MTGPIVYRDQVRPEWVDFNGHMQDAYYALIFSEGIVAVMEALGMDETYRTTTRGTIYTLEAHLWWQKECHEGAEVIAESLLLDVDNKRVHLWQELKHAETGDRLSVMESLLLHVSQRGPEPKAAVFPQAIQAKVDRTFAAHKSLLPVKPRAGHIGIRRRSSS